MGSILILNLTQKLRERVEKTGIRPLDLLVLGLEQEESRPKEVILDPNQPRSGEIDAIR